MFLEIVRFSDMSVREFIKSIFEWLEKLSYVFVVWFLNLVRRVSGIFGMIIFCRYCLFSLGGRRRLVFFFLYCVLVLFGGFFFIIGIKRMDCIFV